MKKDINSAPPKSMNMNVMRQMLFDSLQNNASFFFTQEFAISSGADFFGKILEKSEGAPFFVEDYRMGMLVKGEIDVTVNLISHHVRVGQMVYVGRGSIVHINRMSDDVLVKGFVISADMASQIFPDGRLPLMNSSATALRHEATESDREFFENIFLTTWSLVHTQQYPTDVLHSLLAALFNYYNHIYIAKCDVPQNSSSLFNRFISLVNTHSDKERTITFYAEKLCLSPRYFSTLIQEQSGKSAKYWIDASVVTRAKILLRHSAKTISQISAELDFPNDSFFCKYFRRLTGTSPTEYREEGRG